MSQPAATAPAAVWRRVPGWVFRVLPGHVMMARTGGEHRTVTGRASVVWTALDLPGSTDEVWERILEALPEVGIELDEVEEAIDVLVDAGVVEQAR